MDTTPTMMKFSKIILICAICLRGSVGVDWCSRDLECNGPKNTMCLYQPKTGTVADCTDMKDNQTPEGRQSMLDWHNDYRNRLAGGEMPGWPKAANMRQMYWDDEIESVALRWSLQCVPDHDKCRRTPQFTYVGQNYASSGNTGKYPDMKPNFDMWVAEIKDIADPRGMITRFTMGSWGHFTQVIWSSSYKLGCSDIRYVRNTFMTTAVFCNYGPSGNWQSGNMYQEGEPASRCPPGTGRSNKYPNLCSSPEEDAKSSTRQEAKSSTRQDAESSTRQEAQSSTIKPKSSTTSVVVGWCSQELECRGVKNTMCTYKRKKGTSGGCKQLRDVQTKEGRRRMLYWHNEYRNRLAGGEMPGWPKAANMRQMYWDDEIETIALRWAQQCVNGHDKCRRNLKFSYIGQNYAWSGHTAGFPNPKQNFHFWVAEIKDIADPVAMMTSFRGGSWGHFTQVNWADSYKLGCAEIHYIKNRFKTTADFCNYGPGGNIYTTNMYQAGEPASKCPPGTGPSKTYPNLCSYLDDHGKPMERRSNSSSHFRISLSLLLSAVLMFFV